MHLRNFVGVFVFCSCLVFCSTSPPGGNQVDGLPPVVHDSYSRVSAQRVIPESHTAGTGPAVIQETNHYNLRLKCSGFVHHTTTKVIVHMKIIRLHTIIKHNVR